MRGKAASITSSLDDNLTMSFNTLDAHSVPVILGLRIYAHGNCWNGKQSEAKQASKQKTQGDHR